MPQSLSPPISFSSPGAVQPQSPGPSCLQAARKAPDTPACSPSPLTPCLAVSLCQVTAPISPLTTSPGTALGLAGTRGSVTPHTPHHQSSLPHHPSTSYESRATQSLNSYYLVLTWSPSLGEADKPITPGQSLPHILVACQPSDPTNCLPYPHNTVTTLQTRQATYTGPVAA
ncbi:hypothetical protein E2C01_059396 [Portunus trituberculatus]|uniref:Uncharacterized protein n=1 Tax=Portunus trituberculatus TaxID=210409 RepID=A0A5B7H588_PORTR|nr:hypothetical protein [Portunus trituberculatus]